ncbi:MAG: aldehyde ferredoxin oxidoreductase family protein [Dehalococcoidia bacterium]|nr:aldehyde ferredoxin oxidoreductase family protein [Dehalococcoidia bacterium]
MTSEAGRRLLRVNLTTEQAQKELLPEEDVARLIGGRALGAMILYNELSPGIDPLGPENELIFTTGPLTGTTAQGSSRYCVTTKSPLTGLYLMALSGGYFGPEFKRTGHDVLLIEGKASEPTYLLIKPDGVEFRDARLFWGMNTSNTQEFIKDEVGDERVRIMCIGPAGENLVPFACLVNERRVAGRGGAGAVMGSKNLKAIVVLGNQPTAVADPEAFRQASRQAVADIGNNPVTKVALPALGSNGFNSLFNEMGIMPFRNWQEAASPRVKGLLGEHLRDNFVIKSTHCAPPCSVRTSKITLVREGPCAGALSDGPEYDTTYAFGSCCDIDDMAAIIEADALCDSLGMDTISMGVSLAFAMECFEKGIINRADTGGLELKFGDASLLRGLIHDTAFRRGFGDVIAMGSKKMSERFGKGSEAFAMHAKGMELGGYDPRGAKGIALIFACGPRGGCHHAGGYTAFAEIAMKDGRFATEGKAPIVKRTRDRRVICDSAIMCTFVTLGVSDGALACLLTAATGREVTAEDLYTIGDRGSNVERAFNVREGLRRSWDTLPRRLLEESLASGPTKGQTVDLETLLTDMYDMCGWDVETGIPTQEKLADMGLLDIAGDMKAIKV